LILVKIQNLLSKKQNLQSKGELESLLSLAEKYDFAKAAKVLLANDANPSKKTASK